MITQIKKVMLTLLATGCMLVSEAQLTAPMIFGISQGVKEEKWYANPAVGAILIDSGFVSSLRFWGNWDFAHEADHPDERDYINDQPRDAVMAILRHLFPSPTGVLGGVNSDKFFCNFANATNIAQLVNALGKEGDFFQNIDNWVDGMDAEGKKLFNSGIKNKRIKEFARHLKEVKSCPNYPPRIIEQLLMAFLYENFNTMEDLEAYWKNLSESAKVVGFQFDKNSQLTLESLKSLAENPVGLTSFQCILALQSIDDFQSITPYNMERKLFSNGRAKPYNRKENNLGGEYFADCAETMIRQVINFLIWNNQKKKFAIDELIEKYQSQPHENVGLNNFKNLVTFFTLKQATKIQANNSSPEMRGEWNKVVGDLDGGVLYSRPYHNEVEPGFINMLKILRRILDLPIEDLSELSELLKEGEQNRVAIEKILLQKLQEMFDFIKTSDKTIELTLKKLTISDKDTYGNLKVAISLRNSTEKFSFNVYTGKEHGEVNKLCHEGDVISMSKTPLIKQLENHLSIQQGDRRETTYLAAEQFNIHQDKSNKNLYWLYRSTIDDSESMCQFLERVSTLPDNILGRDNVIAELMKSISWDDDQIYHQYREIYHNLLQKYPDLIKNLGYLNYSRIQSPNGTLNLTSAVGVKKMSLFGSRMRDIKGLSNPGLESLQCSLLEMPNAVLDLSGLTELKKLHLDGAKLGGIKGLENNKSLETLNCSHLKMPNATLDLEGLMGLKTLDLDSAELGAIKGLENKKALEILNCSYLKMPNTVLDLSGLTELKKLDLDGAELGGLKGLENKKALETLGLTELQIPNSTLDLTDLRRLKIIDLRSARLGDIKGLENPNLETLVCLGLQMPKAVLDLSRLSGLKSLNLSWAILRGIHWPENKNSLETLDCSNLEMPDAVLDLSGLTELKELNIRGAELGGIKGLESLKAKIIK
ncbi:MAG: hypothetical protein A2007_03490 [Verrucomicrobia bacterium GWC2_42_7]|nr:MAG: hypothetical protein A2007_03490 [Verrucomicrobia bacterium GWC2_42_7]